MAAVLLKDSCHFFYSIIDLSNYKVEVAPFREHNTVHFRTLLIRLIIVRDTNLLPVSMMYLLAWFLTNDY